MNGTIGWGDFTPNSNKGNSGDRLDFLWLKSGNTYKVRLVAKPVIFYKYFYRNDGKLRTAICKDPTACPVKVAHPELETPGERFAILVIDRADGILKIMEFPKSVYFAISEWSNATQQNPGSDQGVDWQISITGSGKTGTKYTSTALMPIPFTNEEKTAILKVIKNEQGEDSGYLENIFKAHSAELIEKKLFGEWEARGQAPAAQPATAVVAQAPPAAPAQTAPVAQVAQAAPAANVDIDW